MGIISLTEMIHVIRKYFIRLIALSIAIGLIGGFLVSVSQTYTCTLGFKYNHSGALEGLAPDGESKLDPYEIQNPTVVQNALDRMDIDDERLTAKGIRQNITINKVVTSIDQEVSKSAALLGEKYEVVPTEYEMKFTYDASLGDNFGPKMFSNLIMAYDRFLLSKYYNKKKIEDFAKIFEHSDADYIVIADTMNLKLDSIISTLYDLAESYPTFRSVSTGYTFNDLAAMYQNLSNIQYSKYYGNVRMGNLAKDAEMVIKSYQTKIKELEEQRHVNNAIAENYKSEISSFYTHYMESGLYSQAQNMLTQLEHTNNRAQNVYDDSQFRNFTNTYDQIILDYAHNATQASDASHNIDYYNSIIESYANDTVDPQTKARLIAKNEEIIKEITVLSREYSILANDTINELYNKKVNEDLQYLILPEVSPNKPVKFIAAFIMILVFGLGMIAAFIYEIAKKFIATSKNDNEPTENITKRIIDTKGMSELHNLLYKQYLADFSEFHLEYQKMYPLDGEQKERYESFIRWRSPEFGMVSPDRIIECVSDLNLFNEFNEWILQTICTELSKFKEEGLEMPAININCPYHQIDSIILNKSVLDCLKKNQIPTSCICLELTGKDVTNALESIMIIEEMGIPICIDRIENSEEINEIVNVIKPAFIKTGLDAINSDLFATSSEDIVKATTDMIEYLTSIVDKCHANGIKACICGIEKKSQDTIVSKIGFDYKQGYYLSKPAKTLFQKD